MSETAPVRISNLVKWLVIFVASVGFLFDIYEVLIGPLILQPALLELGNLKAGTPEYRDWAARLFWIPSLVGGFFGFWGGYFTDRFGRRRVLVWSILLYTGAALAAGMSSSLPELLVLRALTLAGVFVEFVAGVAWLAELFPEPKLREAVLGGTQAFSSMGGILTAAAFYVTNHWSNSLPAIHGAHAAWRYTLMSGLVPAIPLILIRPFLPESPEWQFKHAHGLLKRPSVTELFSPQFRKTTIVTTLMFAFAYALAFGTIQQAPQITPGLPEVSSRAPALRGEAVASVQSAQETGGLAGRIAIAVLALFVVSRRKLLRLFLLPGIFLVGYVFIYPATASLGAFRIGIFFTAFTTVAQLTFWGSYVPRVYPTYLRGTGEGFAANVGGRMLGTSASYIVTHLAAMMPGSLPSTKLAYGAASIGIVVYGLAILLSFVMDEPPEKLMD